MTVTLIIVNVTFSGKRVILYQRTVFQVKKFKVEVVSYKMRPHQAP